jgi:hypothetical protein
MIPAMKPIKMIQMMLDMGHFSRCGARHALLVAFDGSNEPDGAISIDPYHFCDGAFAGNTRRGPQILVARVDEWVDAFGPA